MVVMKTTISEAIRAALEDSESSRYAIARECGVSESVLSRFVRGERGLTLDTVDRLAKVLGLTIVVNKPKRKRN
jgi:plasmid maintenance system antidote protein VapI